MINLISRLFWGYQKTMREEILLLKIHNAIKEGKNYYQSVQGNWKMNAKRLASIKYVVGIDKQKVVCVFVPNEWHIIQDGPEKGRKCFAGIEASNEILSTMQTNEEQLIKKFGTGSAIAYASLSEVK